MAMDLDMKSGSEEVRTDQQVQPRKRIPGVKSVLVSDDLVDWIRQMQAGASPRMDYRYLIEGAMTIVRERPELVQEMESASRRRMQKDLENLNQLSNLEHKQ